MNTAAKIRKINKEIKAWEDVIARSTDEACKEVAQRNIDMYKSDLVKLA